jgi:hypothetical protein
MPEAGIQATFELPVPALNQVEFQPYLYQRDLLDFCAERASVLEAYSPLTRAHDLRIRNLSPSRKNTRKQEQSGRSPTGIASRRQTVAAFGNQVGCANLDPLGAATQIGGDSQIGQSWTYL